MITSGLPLTSAIYLDNVFDSIKIFATSFLDSDRSTSKRLKLIEKLDEIISQLPSSIFRSTVSEEFLSEVRKLWFRGESLDDLSNIDAALKLCREYYGYTFSWVVGAISNKFKASDLLEEAALMEELAVCAELGLPDFLSAKVFLAGIRSRVAALEVSGAELMDLMFSGASRISEIRKYLMENTHSIKKALKKL